ncbi:MAG: ferritin-like domain-containing protein [Solirubrobacteraceae bacterium]
MTPQTLEEQLIKYLTDVHSIERQALVQMKMAPKIAGDEALSRAFADHLTETEEHERLVRLTLEHHDANPSAVKDAAGVLTGVGFGAFAAVQPDTPGKLLAHAVSYEHMEEAAYEILSLLAGRLDDQDALQTARTIKAQEQGMAQRLEGLYDQALEASLQAQDPSDVGELLTKYLADAHAIERQAESLLRKAPKLAGDGELARAYESHLSETLEHSRKIEERLEARDGSPSRLKDMAMRAGALNWGAFFQAQPDTPAKLAAFAYAFEHLEIASYELLRRVAERAQDTQTVQVATSILAEERAAAERIQSLFSPAFDASLREQDVALGADR